MAYREQRFFDSEDIVGAKVQNPQGEHLGKVEAVVLSPDSPNWQVTYFVLSFGGFLGIGDKLFAIPSNVFSWNSAKDCFVISVDKETLKNSPGFDKNHWPDLSNPNWDSSIHKYYGVNQHRTSH